MAERDARIVGNTASWSERKFQAILQIEEHGCATAVPCTDYTLCLQIPAIAVEPHFLPQIVNARGDESFELSCSDHPCDMTHGFSHGRPARRGGGDAGRMDNGLML